MSNSSSKKNAAYRKKMAEKGYSRISVYAPTNARALREKIVDVTEKMIKEYEEQQKPQ